MKIKTITVLLIVGLVVLAAMMAFTTPALAVTNEELDNYDPTYEEPTDTGEDMGDPAWNGTITNADTGEAMPGLKVEIFKKKWLMSGWWKVGENTTDSLGEYLIVHKKPMILKGHYAMRISSGSTHEIYERDIGNRWSGDWFWGNPVRCMWNCPWNQTSEIPEFATIAIPVVAVLGLFLFYSHRKRKEE